MSKRISILVTAVAVAGFMFFSIAVSSLSALALSATGTGVGYRSSSGYWLGSYQLDDGTRGFCLEAGKTWPVGRDTELVDGATLGWFGPSDAARLAYISRMWAMSDDRVTTAGGQIATWIIAGVGDHTEEELASRAGADGDAVLARARAMVAEATREATTSVSASAVLELSESGPGRLRVELTTEGLDGSRTNVPSERHRARVELTGATFSDGTTSSEIANGTDVEVMPTSSEPTSEVSATAQFSNLPYGDRLLVGRSGDDVQALLVSTPATATASASVSGVGVSPRPVQPIVSTQTSHPTAAPGARISDLMAVDVLAGDGLLPTWGVFDDGTAMSPIVVTVDSSLLGPFSSPIEQSSEIPAGAPTVCTVSTEVSGPGEYRTPECVIETPGHYVWVERIDPAKVPADRGGSRIRPWQSDFGIASEITVVEPAHLGAAVLAETGTRSDFVAPLSAGLAIALGCNLIVLNRLRRRRPSPRSMFR
ncbi:hypothetical protein ACPPVQ_16365 [Diaminobutyricibacter sp. McL0618]|uniref:hypothetical protein n=1 Tax=Leifsonia sp. McL0618 TaxID=3415677 RepID=UPI003CF85D41